MDLVLLLITDNTIPLPTGPVYSQDILFKHSKYTRTPVKDIYPEVIERLIIHDPDTERGHE